MSIPQPKLVIFESDKPLATAKRDPQGSQINLTSNMLKMPKEGLEALLRHELFHLRPKRSEHSYCRSDYIEEEKAADFAGGDYGKSPQADIRKMAYHYTEVRDFEKAYRPALDAIIASLTTSYLSPAAQKCLQMVVAKEKEVPTAQEKLLHGDDTHHPALQRITDQMRRIDYPESSTVPERAANWLRYLSKQASTNPLRPTHIRP